jgi:hypothetical protein
MVPQKYRFTAENAEGAEVTYLLDKGFSAISATSAVKKPFLRLYHVSFGKNKKGCHPVLESTGWQPIGHLSMGGLRPIESNLIVIH